eukprot:5880106-Alexandrium_andersonii.AAC.1
MSARRLSPDLSPREHLLSCSCCLGAAGKLISCQALAAYPLVGHWQVAKLTSRLTLAGSLGRAPRDHN